MSPRARYIPLEEIASSLPINVWFERIDFEKATSINPGSAIARMREMTRNKQLSHKSSPGQNSYWKMTHVQKSVMLSFAELNRAKRGKPSGMRLNKDFQVKSIVEAEKQAYYQHAEMLLKSIKFI
jgi:hypothetical protein